MGWWWSSKLVKVDKNGKKTLTRAGGNFMSISLWETKEWDALGFVMDLESGKALRIIGFSL